MSEVIDKLIFALDGDLTLLKAKYAEAEAGAAKTGTAIATNLDKPMKAAAASAAASANTLKKALGDVEAATTKTHGSTATATREFRALFDELSSGRTRMTPGTLAIIATRVFGISGATLAWAAAIAAVPAAFGVATVMLENDMARIDRSMQATGYAAGATRDQILSIGQALALTSKLSIRGGTDLAAILASRGNINASLLPAASIAAGHLATATGSSLDDAGKALEKILENPTRGAQELYDEFKLLDAAQADQIKKLEAAGDKYDAQKIIIDALNKRFANLEDNTWSLAKAFEGVGKFFSNLWFHTGGLFGGADTTDAQKLAGLQADQADIVGRFKPLGGLAGARRTALNEPGLGVGDFSLKHLLDNFDSNAAQIKTLIGKMGNDHYLARTGAARANNDAAIRAGLGDVDTTDKFATHLKDLRAELARDNLAVTAAAATHSKFTDVLKKQRDAVATALRNQLNPAQEATLRAAEDTSIHAASPHDRAALRAKIDADRKRRENLANPETVPYADAIYAAQMASAGADRYDTHAAADAAKKDKNLAAMLQEADAAEAMARAFDISTAAADRAKIVGEAHLAVVKGEISNELAYAGALQRRAFSQAAVAAAENIAALRNSNAGLGGVAGAGGNPAAIAAARRNAEALAITQKERDNAVTAEQIAFAQKHLDKLREELRIRDQLNRLISTNATDADLQDANTLAQKELDLKYEDASLRAKEIADLQAVIQLKQLKQEVDDAGYQKELERRKQLLEAKAALTTETNDQQIWGELRQGLDNTLLAGVHGFNSMAQAASDFLSQLAQMTLQLFILQPLLNILLGKSGTTGGGVLGGLFGSIGSFVGGLFGGGKAEGGWIDPAKFYLVGEKGPEILGPGAGGRITPLTAPQSSGAAGGNTTMNIRHELSVSVSGVGDKDLLAKIHAGTTAVVAQSIDQNNKALKRTQRGTLISANRRALP